MVSVFGAESNLALKTTASFEQAWFFSFGYDIYILKLVYQFFPDDFSVPLKATPTFNFLVS